MRNYPKALKRKLLDTMGLLTKPAYHWKYDIMKKERRGGWECN